MSDRRMLVEEGLILSVTSRKHVLSDRGGAVVLIGLDIGHHRPALLLVL